MFVVTRLCFVFPCFRMLVIKLQAHRFAWRCSQHCKCGYTVLSSLIWSYYLHALNRLNKHNMLVQKSRLQAFNGCLFFSPGLTSLSGDYKHWTRGPEDWGTEDPRTRGPEDPKTRDLRTQVLRAVLHSSRYL